MQEACRGGDGLFDIEGIGKAALLRRIRHELRNALCTDRADGIMVETAFLPDQPGEEITWDAVSIGIGADELADASHAGCLLLRWARFACRMRRNNNGRQAEKL